MVRYEDNEVLVYEMGPRVRSFMNELISSVAVTSVVTEEKLQSCVTPAVLEEINNLEEEDGGRGTIDYVVVEEMEGGVQVKLFPITQLELFVVPEVFYL